MEDRWNTTVYKVQKTTRLTKENMTRGACSLVKNSPGKENEAECPIVGSTALYCSFED